MKKPSLITVKRLFAVSGNICSFPDCDSILVEISGTVVGEIAHIKAAKKDGPRYDPLQSEEERHCFDNLILLCRRHHKLIDSDPKSYSVELLRNYKKKHEQEVHSQITPFTEQAAKLLIQNTYRPVLKNNKGLVQINSPGSTQTQYIFNSKTQKTTISPPNGAVASNLKMNAYIEYLIGKYQEYQKLDSGKDGRYKYMAIYEGVKREFGSKWQLVPEERFLDLVQYLQIRIDYTKIGRIRKKGGQQRYHSYEEHLAKYFPKT